ncbi:MAG TPA: hypothetical protein VLD61_01525 [Methylomirabilota bacterium]|nr:hypothetical protein [Methylomirabilota bacterium]
MVRRRHLSVLPWLTMILAGCASLEPGQAPSGARRLGSQVEIGSGTVATYAELNGRGEPTAIGVVFSPTALDGLPTSGSDAHHCFDRNKDGTIDPGTECLHAYEFVIPLPDVVTRRADVPFKWVLLNWNPAGHIPPGIYDVPHFDVHFYLEPIAKVFAIQAGPCGPEFVRCDQFQMARRPVPSNYIHPDFKDVEAVVPAMGNHLIDVTSPEFHGQPFTRSWIFGVYDGKITFYEEMVTRAVLLSKPSTCFPIKSPPAVERRGLYPTRSCLRHDARTGEYTISMEAFVLREAQAPAPR